MVVLMISFLIFETAVLMIIAIAAVLLSKIMSEQQPVDQAEVYPTSYWVSIITRQSILIIMNLFLLIVQNEVLNGAKDHMLRAIGHSAEVVIVLSCLAGVIIIPILQQAVRAENWLDEHEPADAGKHAKQSNQQKSNVGQTQQCQAIKPTAGLVVKSVAELLTLTNHDADSIQNRSKN